MRILSLTNCPLDAQLGSGKTVLAFTQGLRSHGFEVDVASPTDFEALSRVRKMPKFRQAWGAWKYTQRRLREKKYDLIEHYGDEFWLAMSKICRQRDRPFLVSHTNGLELLDRERSHFYAPVRNRLRRWFNRQTHERFSRLAFASTDGFVSLCELDRKYVLNLGLFRENRTELVPPGIDSQYLRMPFHSVKENRIAYVGSWISRKGIRSLIKVMTNILMKDVNFIFDIYGTQGVKQEVYAAFPDSVHSQIVVHPRLSSEKVADGLARAKVFFFPSQYEGFGMAIAEAMACSCAAVVTPTGFGGEVENKSEAIVCEFDDVVSMEEAVMHLLRDEESRVAIARRGWNRVQSLTWEGNVEKLAGVYRRWIEEGVA